MDLENLPLKTQPNAFDKLIADYIPVGNAWYTPAELAKLLQIENPVLAWLKQNQTLVLVSAASLFALALLSRGRR